MTDELKTAIKLLAEKITSTSSPDEALKYTQAALNLAHTVATIHNMKSAS